MKSLPENVLRSKFFFDEYTWESSYIIGLIMSDGCLDSSRNRVRIGTCDEQLAKVVSNILGTGYKIFLSVGQLAPNGVGKKNICQISFSDLYVRTRLETVGLVPRKSGAEVFPKGLPKSMVAAFLLGVFDGDGFTVKERSGRIRSGFVCSSMSFLEEISNQLVHLGMGAGSCRWDNKSRCGYLRYACGDTFMLRRIFYNDNPAFEKCLHRKRDIIFKSSLPSGKSKWTPAECKIVLAGKIPAGRTERATIAKRYRLLAGEFVPRKLELLSNHLA